jgi:hypothetical protein
MFAGRYFGGRHFGRRFFGKVGLVVDGAYNGSRYFGLRYFGQRHFGTSSSNVPQAIASTNTPALFGVLGLAGNLVYGADFALAQTSGISLSATASFTAALSFDNEDWAFTPPLAISGMVGAVTVAGNFVTAASPAGPGGYFGRRFYGGRYFGPRYFGSPAGWILTPTGALSLSGQVGVAGGFATDLAFGFSPLALSGALAVAGDIDGGAAGAAAINPLLSGGGRRRLPGWAKQPGKPSPLQVDDRQQAADDDQRLLDLVQALYDGGVFNPR